MPVRDAGAGCAAQAHRLRRGRRARGGRAGVRAHARSPALTPRRGCRCLLSQRTRSERTRAGRIACAGGGRRQGGHVDVLGARAGGQEHAIRPGRRHVVSRRRALHYAVGPPPVRAAGHVADG
eukprot:5775366-Prymnesium_polylepis.1